MADILQLDRMARASSGMEGIHYKGKDWLWSQDLQGGGYSNINQLQYDTQSVSNSGQWILWSEAFLSVPYQISATNIGYASTGGYDTAAAVCWKAGYWNLVESCQISCQNRTVNNLASKTNMIQCARALINPDYQKATYSLLTYGFTQDTAESNTFVGGATTGGYCVNNRILGSATQGTGPYSTLVSTVNTGLINRAKFMCFEPPDAIQTTTTLANTYRPFSQLVSTTTMRTSGIAVIPLKYISSFFSEEVLGMPLKNLRMYLQVNINQGSAVYNTTTHQTTASTFPFGTIPITLTDAGIANIISGDTSTVTLAIGTYNGTTTPTRLYYPQVQLPAQLEAKIPQVIKHTVCYRDMQYFQLQGVTAGAQFNWQISKLMEITSDVKSVLSDSPRKRARLLN